MPETPPHGPPRSSPDWDDAPIDFILFGDRILGNAANGIRRMISSVRFWHLLVGMPDFTDGGGRRARSLRSFKRQGRTDRKIPVAITTLGMVDSLQSALGARIGDRPCAPSRTVAIGVFCESEIGFFYILRVGELSALNGETLRF